MIIKEVKLEPAKVEKLRTEHDCGLKYAVVYQGSKIIALFDSDYWAQEFVKQAGFISFTIREVAE